MRKRKSWQRCGARSLATAVLSGLLSGPGSRREIYGPPTPRNPWEWR